jgi:hypothetical protein
MVLGFWAGALYTLIALQTCGNDWKRFWYGKRFRLLTGFKELRE